ncbi:MAG: hypothetical protein HOP37_11330 [Cyclobacteriaceae bacterium]|nr:hypothetical protein [Cyclobacteriaceae bacterium]
MPTSIIDGTRIEHKLPWRTWVIPFILFPIGSYISLLFKFDTGIGSFYLPTAIAVVLINWWGPSEPYLHCIFALPYSAHSGEWSYGGNG